MKPLGTNNAVENGLTTPKSAFGKLISQCGLSTKSLKPRGIYNTRENVISANKSAFVPTNSPSGVATKNRPSIALLCKHQRTKQPLGQVQNFGLKQLELSSDDQRLISIPSKQLLNFKLKNMILIASFFWRLTPN
ncbi:hypothetical protein P3592_19030 [Vibrio parahaemolyticus]|nr:hypothetical protein [Vibrio parahaemolyticus]MDF4810621.1 hypothetical protein [Vibrio parahaemolyticus]MDF4853871.1 hypothetical protein [Vibrio parahaemolyticus]HCG5914026.1 hypothetical protein [Vibrio parahaemolyticus]HCG9001466.1 hypothetical protein [Vibrio parahaemolyticus]